RESESRRCPCGAAVDRYGLTVGDQVDSRPSQARLQRRCVGGADLKRKALTAQRVRDRAAPHTPQCTGFSELIQIAPNGDRRDPETLGKLGHLDPTVTMERVEDLLLPELAPHARPPIRRD